ncbi:GDP-mannose pyrophosphorylase/mannose-1-phosphate guanylyltransferase, partial [Pseudoloma neurophilia]
MICKTAIILVGGFGTRLRPLTLTRPKPLIPFCNLNIIEHQIRALIKNGVNKIILATNYKTNDIVREMTLLSKDLNVKILFSVEDQPLDTGGPLKLASKFISNEKFVYVLNSDVICNYPFDKMLKIHLRMKKSVTILTKRVDDPLRFGVIIQNGLIIEKFIEKPKIPISNIINAGIYIINIDIIKNIPDRKISLEKEIFTSLAQNKELVACELEGYWKDIGQFKDYLEAQRLYLENLFYGKENSNDCDT